MKKINHGISLTFGDQAENHHGNQMIGTALSSGFDSDDFNEFEKICIESKWDYEFIDLNLFLPEEIRTDDFAGVLVLRNGINLILGDGSADKLYNENICLPFDKKYFDQRRGKVLNKNARWNLCYGDFSQNANYEIGNGTVINFSDVPVLNSLRKELPKYMGNKCDNIQCELNYYYDLSKTYIGYHGDVERKIVICARLGGSYPLFYQWYNRSKPVGNRCDINLDHGDMYIMSEKAVGFDWKKSSLMTLRHASGYEQVIKKYTKK